MLLINFKINKVLLEKVMSKSLIEFFFSNKVIVFKCSKVILILEQIHRYALATLV